ncbi:MAG TPA: hypothetical protein V6D15_17810 [Oculatellaceae cyanobacterium]|jgi:hypothetical protein
MRFSIPTIALSSCFIISTVVAQTQPLKTTVPTCTQDGEISGSVIQFGAADRTMYASTTIDAKGKITINPTLWNHSSPGFQPIVDKISPSTVQAIIKLANNESFWTLKSDPYKYALGEDSKTSSYFTANPIKFIKINQPCANHTVTVSLGKEGEMLRFTRNSNSDRRLRVLSLKQLHNSTQLSSNQINQFDEIYELLKDLEAGVTQIPLGQASIPHWGNRNLLDIALQVAQQSNNAIPDSIKYIETTRQKLDRLPSKLNNPLTEKVYLVMMKGNFTLNSVPRPMGAKSPSGNNLNLIVDGNTGQVRSLGINNLPADLKQLGDIKDLTQLTKF